MMASEEVTREDVRLSSGRHHRSSGRVPVDHAAGEPVEHFRECFALQLEDSFLKRLGGIVGTDFADGLVNDRTVIELVVDQMDRTAAHFDSIVHRSLMNAKSVEAVAAE